MAILVTLLILLILFCSVTANHKLSDEWNLTSATNENFRQKISPELDEIEFHKSFAKQLISESKGGVLQRLLSSVTFVCKGRFEGYYADTEFDCQTFHYCKQNGLRFTFVCPTDSIFNQREMTCDHNVSEAHNLCVDSHNYYYLNAILYAQKKEVLNNTNVTLTVPHQNSLKIWPHFQKINKNILKVESNNESKQMETILPFKGFVSSHHKNNSNQSNDKSDHKLLKVSSILLNTEKPMIEQEHLTQTYDKWATNMSAEQHSNKSFLTKIKAMNTENVFFRIKDTNNSIEDRIPFYSNNSNQINWDDIETGIKVERPHYLNFKPNFNEMVNPINLINYGSTAPIPLPVPPVPIIKSEPLVVLRPNYIPGTLPIATLYKQTEYMFGKPHIIHKGLYLNPSYGAALVGPQSVMGTQPFVSPIGLVPSPSDRLYPKVFPKNSKILSNFQNVLTKISFNDIFSSKNIPLSQMSPKRKGSDKSNNSLLKFPKISKIPPFDKIGFNLENPFHSTRLLINERLSNEENSNLNPYLGFGVNLDKKVLLNDEWSHVEQVTISPKSNEPIFQIKPKSLKYSLKMDENMDSKHIITQPSIFTNITNNKTKKWVENYAKIKKKYIEREKKFQQNARKVHRRRNLHTFDHKAYKTL